jgi:hypothetical protein
MPAAQLVFRVKLLFRVKLPGARVFALYSLFPTPFSMVPR